MRMHLVAPNAEHLRSLISDKLVENATELAKNFGCSKAAVSAWINNRNPAPRWTLLAAEGLRRRRRAEAFDLYIVSLPIAKPDAPTVMQQVARSFGGRMSQAVLKHED